MALLHRRPFREKTKSLENSMFSRLFCWSERRDLRTPSSANVDRYSRFSRRNSWNLLRKFGVLNPLSLKMQISKGMRCTPFDIWSERRDLNSRPPGPEPGALPSCATPRVFCWKAAYDLEPAKANSYRPNRAGMNWSQCRDSNPGPAHYECAALPTELHWLAQLFIITPNAALVTTSMPRKAEKQGIYFWRGIDPNAASWFIL